MGFVFCRCVGSVGLLWVVMDWNESYYARLRKRVNHDGGYGEILVLMVVMGKVTRDHVYSIISKPRRSSMYVTTSDSIVATAP